MSDDIARRPTRDLVPNPGPGSQLSLADPGFDGEGEPGFDLKQMLHHLWLKKWWIALATLLGVAAGFFLNERVDPVYQSRATVWVESQDRQRGPIQAADLFEGQGWADLVVSMAVVEPVVRNRDLFLEVSEDTPAPELFEEFEIDERVATGSYELRVAGGDDYELRRRGGSERVLERGAAGDSIGRDLGFRWRPSPDALEPGTSVRFSVASPARTAIDLRDRMSVQFNPRSGNLITTELEWNDPEEAAEIHNAILESFLTVAHDLRTQKLREVVGILEEQTEVTAGRLRAAELALEEFRVETITLPTEPEALPIAGGQMTRDPVFGAYFERKVEARQLEVELEQLEQMLQRVRSGEEINIFALQVIPAVDRSPDLANLLRELRDKQAQLRSILYEYTEEYPEVGRLEEEIATLRNRTIPTEMEALAERLRGRIGAIESEIQGQAAELRQIPARSIEEARLRRNTEMAEQLHNTLLVRLKEAELAASTDLPDLQVVDRATPPGRPTRNGGPTLFLMASMGGLGLGLGGVLLFGRLDHRVRHPDHISEQLGLPVLGIVPRIRPGADPASADGVGVLESFRSIRAQITRRKPTDGNFVLITSPSPRDGKSLVAANLAISFAAAGGRTLLLDGDLRRGNVEQFFDVPDRPGLSDYLHGRAHLLDVLRTTEINGLSLLPHGNLRQFDPELLESDRMAELFDHLRERYDAVVVDGPPLVAGADPMVLGERCDKAVMILRTGVTDGDLVRAKLEGIGAFEFPLIGAILNAVPDSAPYYQYFSSYSYYLDGEVVA